MSRQITITRTELGLGNLSLQDPTNGYFVSDIWSNGGSVWQRYTAATSPFAHGETVVAQRLQNTNEIVEIYLYAPDNTALQTRLTTLRNALAQYRYDVTINWDSKIYTYEAAGAADLEPAGDIDPILHKGGWHKYRITIPRRPTI